MGNAALQLIEKQHWLDRAAEQVQTAVQKFFSRLPPDSAQKTKDFLHGTWLGHPLHPVVTDIPVGSWTAALVMDALEDITGNEACGGAARTAIGVGLVGAVAAAASGITDWHVTAGKPRSLGLVHGTLNLTAAALYTASFIQRGNGNGRKSGRGLSWLGFAIAGFSAYLGGHLVYRQRVGVDHAIRGQLPSDFTPVLADSELQEGQMKAVEKGEARILLARCDGAVYATSDVCSHLGGPLSEGKLDGCEVTCPWHGSVFSVKEGNLIHGPATAPLPRMEARVRDGQIEVRLLDDRT